MSSHPSASDRCADRIAISDVMLNYAASIDEGDLERYRRCFAQTVEIVGFGDQTLHGVEAWLDYVSGALQKFKVTQHLLSPVLATVDGDHAQARTDVQATHIMAADDSRFTLWATYCSQMQRHQDTWQITRHELVVRATETR